MILILQCEVIVLVSLDRVGSSDTWGWPAPYMDEPNAEKDTSLECTSTPDSSCSKVPAHCKPD